MPYFLACADFRKPLLVSYSFLSRLSQGIVEQLASDASTSDEEHFRLSLVQLDVERAKWLLRAYLRSRLDKVSPSFEVEECSDGA